MNERARFGGVHDSLPDPEPHANLTPNLTPNLTRT